MEEELVPIGYEIVVEEVETETQKVIIKKLVPTEEKMIEIEAQEKTEKDRIEFLKTKSNPTNSDIRELLLLVFKGV